MMKTVFFKIYLLSIQILLKKNVDFVEMRKINFKVNKLCIDFVEHPRMGKKHETEKEGLLFELRS